jgi:hypothetical protein
MRLAQILELLEASVLCAGFDNSIGECLMVMPRVSAAMRFPADGMADLPGG